MSCDICFDVMDKSAVCRRAQASLEGRSYRIGLLFVGLRNGGHILSNPKNKSAPPDL
jgi:hypothetical protein